MRQPLPIKPQLSFRVFEVLPVSLAKGNGVGEPLWGELVCILASGERMEVLQDLSFPSCLLAGDLTVLLWWRTVSRDHVDALP